MTDYKNIFLDTAPVTYYLKENAQFFDAVTGFMNRYAEAHFHTSVITLMEYSVMLCLFKRCGNKHCYYQSDYR